MKYGVNITAHDNAAEPGFLVEVSRAAEEHGFESVWMSEPNPCMPDNSTTEYPYSRDGSWLRR
jgi:alkanesulfonate monooxygenase SsuD/methylene tetrahydromethanopterin reductase-like flavin-dependent oxidoreductase (luciferase family)